MEANAQEGVQFVWAVTLDETGEEVIASGVMVDTVRSMWCPVSTTGFQ